MIKNVLRVLIVFVVIFIIGGVGFAVEMFSLKTFIYESAEIAIETGEKMNQIIEEAENKRVEEINTLVSNEFMVYLDGEEVDVTKIDVSFYKSSIDYDNKIIYITKK